MDKIKISVTIPVYNCEKYIKDAIDSVLKQTFQDFEIIVVDDGSTDKTLDVLESYNDNRIHIFKKDHEGEAASRNFAMSQAKGEFVALLDSDDMMLPDRLEYQYTYMTHNPMTDIISGTMNYIDETGKNIGGFDFQDTLVTFKNLSNGNLISNPAAFIRMSTWKKKQIIYQTTEDYFYAPDYKFWVDALLKGYKIEVLSKKVTNYRKHQDQLTSSKASNQIRCANNIKLYLKAKYHRNASFITFSNSTSNFSFDRIKYEADDMELFQNIYCYTEKDFDEEYWDKYKDNYLNYPRGFGYWAWKPYFIKKTLERCNNGDIVVYADTGCMLLKEHKSEMERWMHIAASSESGILSPCYGPYIEHDWSRGDLYEYINTTYNKNNVDIFNNAIQCGAGILIVCKNDKSVDFINQWNDIMSEHFHLCTDEPSTKPNHTNFKENRHDQSAFSMLSKIYGIETIETKYGILDKENSPIICTRCKGDKDTWKKPIKVLYDHQTYDLQKFGGISRMYVELSKETDRNEIVDNFTGSGIARGNYAKCSSDFSVLGTNNSYLKQYRNYGEREANVSDNREYTIKHLKEGNFDVFYPTFFDPYFLQYLNGKPFVMSIHDMIPELYPQYFPKNDMQIVGKRVMAEQASLIEVPTETTKKDVIRILGVKPDKIRVIGRGYNKEFSNQIYAENPIGSPYILYVGQRNLYKRFDWFVKHIVPFLKSHEGIKVVCTGSKFTQKEIDLFNQYGVGDRFLNGMMDDLMLASLYHYALCFVYSSEYEGFGMPILEAYQCGCIALLNNNECFKEVTNNKALYFDLKESESNLSDKLEWVYSLGKSEKESILNTQYQILSNYSWKKSADKLIDIFNEAIKKSEFIPEEDDSRLDIFICAHKDFDEYPHNDIYKVIHGPEELNVDLKQYYDENTKITPMEFSYAEGSRMYWLWKNYDVKKYIGICHYRKYFDFYDKVPNMDNIFEGHDIILTNKTYWGSNFQRYQIWHNINDIMVLDQIIKTKYKDYQKSFTNVMMGGEMYICNMFIMKKEDYNNYCKFVFSVLDDFAKLRGFKSDKDIKKYVINHKLEYIKNFYPNNTIEYQSRLMGFLLERLTNVYIKQHFNNPYHVKMIETSEKYTTVQEKYEK